MSELYHHGIKGQRWGIKNGPPYPLNSDHGESQTNEDRKITLNDSQKKLLKAIVISGAAIGLGAAVYVTYKKLCISNIAKIAATKPADKILISEAKKVMKKVGDDTDIVLSKGTIIRRMDSNADFDVSKYEGPMYAAYKKLDVLTYKYFLPDYSGKGVRYDVQMEAMKELRGPSYDKAKEIFEQLYFTNKEYREGLENAVTNRLYNTYKGRYSKSLTDSQILDKAKERALAELKRDSFKTAISNFVVKNDKNTSILINEYLKNGYDFVEDYLDKGVVSESPIIMLNANASLKQNGINFVNMHNEHNAELLLKLLKR